MDLIQLDYFVCACDKGSFSGAADCRYTTQPNVSKKIRELEAELGQPLLERSRRGVIPTAYGKIILEHARMMLKTADTISSLSSPGKQKGLWISTYPSNMMSRLLVDYYRAFPEGCTVDHRIGTPEKIAENVRRGISEIGIVYMAKKQVRTYQRALEKEQLTVLPLKDKSICLYVGPENPLYEAESVPFSQLPDLKFIKGCGDFYSPEHYLEQISGGTVCERDLFYAVSTESEHLTVDAMLGTELVSMGLNFVYDPYENYDIRAIPILGGEQALTVSCIGRESVPLSESAQWVLKRLEQML